MKAVRWIETYMAALGAWKPRAHRPRKRDEATAYQCLLAQCRRMHTNALNRRLARGTWTERHLRAARAALGERGQGAVQ